MNTLLKTTFIISVFFAISCSSKKVDESNISKASNPVVTEKPKVELIELIRGNYYKEILCNGKLYALRKAELKFPINDLIEKVNVKNGDRISKNEVIASLSNYTYLIQLNKAKIQYEKALIEMKDVLIGQGYPEMDSTKVPEAFWKIGRIRSGLDNATVELQSANFNYSGTILKAPFDGIIANLKSKAHNMPSASEPFCMIIDNSSFEAEFQVLESEISGISPNEAVTIIPFALDSVSVRGKITEINPLIDENGLVTVKAVIPNYKNLLFEGMNVRVVIREVLAKQLVVPKQSVVQRQGKEVVFTCENGLAKWNYVITAEENTTSYTIKDGLREGMNVIVSGNLNLAHDAEVEVVGEGH